MPKSKNNRKGKSRNDRRPAKRSKASYRENPYRREAGQSADPSTRSAPPKQPDRQCKYLDRVATLPNLFSPDECADIINNGLNNWTEKESQIQRDADGKIEQNFVEDLDYRNTTLFIPSEPDKELFDKILGNIMGFNSSGDGFGFEIAGMAEPPNMMRYLAPDIHPKGMPGKYDWHMDVGPGPVPSMRKLSYSILLNAGEYEGGELAFHIGRNAEPHPGQTETSSVGNIVCFPSYLIHRVLPVTKDTRYSMVGWVHGNSFR